MRLASFVISFCLHAGFVLLVLFWPAPALRQAAPHAMTVSLVDGLPGGDRTPSPILGPQSAPVQKPAPPLPPAPPKEPSPPVIPKPPPEAVPVPIQETPPLRLEAPEHVPKPAPEPAPKPPPEPDTVLLTDKKAEEPKQPEPKQPQPPKEEPKKPEKPQPPKPDPAAEALAKLRAEAKSNAARTNPNAVAQALAAARKQSGGGGGEGEGEGGGGIGDIYGAQIVMAVQPNWHWHALAQGNLSVTLYLKVDATGLVLDVRVETSSGNPLFDSSAVAAVRRTHTLPPPPSPAFREIVLPFFPMR